MSASSKESENIVCFISEQDLEWENNGEVCTVRVILVINIKEKY